MDSSELLALSSCRICGSLSLKGLVDFGVTPFCDAFTPLSGAKSERFRLNLLGCEDCRFAQLDVVAEGDLIYRDYLYVSSSSRGLSAHFEEYAFDIFSFFKSVGLTVGKILDVGCNDGLLLLACKRLGWSAVGVEPSQRAAEAARSKDIDVRIDYFSTELATKLKSENSAFDVISFNNVFANINDLHALVDAASTLLSDVGVISIETSHIDHMTDNLVFDFIYHEHLSYFSFTSLCRLFGRHGLRPIRVKTVATKGGSLRVFFTKNNSYCHDQSVAKLIAVERARPPLSESFKYMMDAVRRQRKRVWKFLDDFKKNGAGNSRIAVYGASATSTTFLHFFQLNEMFDFYLDDNPIKVGMFGPGNGAPVFSLSDVNLAPSDLVIVSAWRYAEVIVERLRSYGCKIIVPLPIAVML